MGKIMFKLKNLVNLTGAAALVLCGFSLAGCASTKYSLAESASPMAILGVAGNTHVPYYSEEVREDEYGEEDGLLSNAINGFLGRNNPEIQTAADRVAYAENAFRRIVPEATGIEVLPKETVLASPTYDDIGKNSILSYVDVKIRGDGYKFMDDIGSKKARLIAAETGASSFVFLDFTFKKYIKGSGDNLNADLGAMGIMSVIVFDKTGKKVIHDDFTVISDKSVEMRWTKYDKDEMVELFPDVIDQLISRFVVKYL